MEQVFIVLETKKWISDECSYLTPYIYMYIVLIFTGSSLLYKSSNFSAQQSAILGASLGQNMDHSSLFCTLNDQITLRSKLHKIHLMLGKSR